MKSVRDDAPDTCAATEKEPLPLRAERTDFAGLIRCWREKRGLSLSQAAGLAGLTKAHLWELEQRRACNPCVSTLVGLSRAYGASLAYLGYLSGTAWVASREAESSPRQVSQPIREAKP